jgi:hypothetical protein
MEIQGLAYPFTVVNGGLGISSDIDLIRQQVFSVLETERYERVMNSGYGLPNFLFDSAANDSIVPVQVSIALAREIPSAEFQVTGSIEESGDYRVQVGWSVNNVPQSPLSFALS